MVEPSAPSKMTVELESDEEEKTDVTGVFPPEVEPSAPPANIIARFEAECCICQDDQVTVCPVF